VVQRRKASHPSQAGHGDPALQFHRGPDGRAVRADLRGMHMDRFRGLKVGIQGWALRQFDLPDFVYMVAELGVKHLAPTSLGLAGISPEDPEKADRLVELCNQLGITIETVNAKFRGEADEEAQRPNFELAKRMGVKVITGGIGADRLPVLDALAAEYDMVVGIHNHGPGGILSDVEAIGKILEPHSERIGLCVDTGHYLRLPLDPVEVVREFGDRVHAIHVRDMDPDKDPVKGDGGNYVEYIVGEGPMDLDGLMRLLLERKYQGAVALEYKPNPHNPMPDLRKSLQNMEAALERVE